MPKKSSPKKAPQPKRPKQQGRNIRPRAARTKTQELSPCARDYALALVDPENAPLACVPSEFPPLPSQKIKTFNRGSAQVGTAGYGFVSVDPRDSVTNDGSPVFYTTSAYAGTSFATSVTAGVAIGNMNGPYAVADYAGGVAGNLLKRFRLVGCALKVWYAGTEMNLSGEMIAVRHPDNVALAGLTNTQILAIPGSSRYPVTSLREMVHVHWIPVDPVDVEYSGVLAGSAPSMGILFTGVSGSQFNYEVWTIYEVIGLNVASRTASHADPEGFSAVLTAAQSIGDTSWTSIKSAAGNLVSMASAELSRMSGHVVRGAMHAGAAYLMGGMGRGASGPPRITVEEMSHPGHSASSPTQPPPHSQPKPPPSRLWGTSVPSTEDTDFWKDTSARILARQAGRLGADHTAIASLYRELTKDDGITVEAYMRQLNQLVPPNERDPGFA